MTTPFNWSSSSEPWQPKWRQNIITVLTTLPQGWVSARKHQRMTAINTMWTEFSWTFPESYTADVSWIMHSRQKCLYLHHRGEFQPNYYMFVSLHDSDHDSVVRIFPTSCEVIKLHYRLDYITRHNVSPTRSVIWKQMQNKKCEQMVEIINEHCHCAADC